jgi:hypothetical protein
VGLDAIRHETDSEDSDILPPAGVARRLFDDGCMKEATGDILIESSNNCDAARIKVTIIFLQVVVDDIFACMIVWIKEITFLKKIPECLGMQVCCLSWVVGSRGCEV